MEGVAEAHQAVGLLLYECVVYLATSSEWSEGCERGERCTVPTDLTYLTRSDDY